MKSNDCGDDSGMSGLFTGFTTGNLDNVVSKRYRKCPLTFNAKEIYGVSCLREECMAWDYERKRCQLFEEYFAESIWSKALRLLSARCARKGR